MRVQIVKFAGYLIWTQQKPLKLPITIMVQKCIQYILKQLFWHILVIVLNQLKNL